MLNNNNNLIILIFFLDCTSSIARYDCISGRFHCSRWQPNLGTNNCSIFKFEGLFVFADLCFKKIFISSRIDVFDSSIECACANVERVGKSRDRRAVQSDICRLLRHDALAQQWPIHRSWRLSLHRYWYFDLLFSLSLMM